MRVRRVVIAVVSAAVLALTGCGSEGSSSTGAGETTPSGSPSESVSEQPSASPSEEASEDPYAGVEPATGPVLEMESVLARLPEGWKRQEVTSQLHSGEKGDLYVALAEVAPIVPPPLDKLARSMSTSRIDTKKLDRTANVWIGGREWLTLEGPATNSPGRPYYIVEHAIPLDDSVARFIFTFPVSMSPAGREEFMAPVLASLEWR